MDFLPIPSNLGIILSKNPIGTNIAKIINNTCKKIIIPVNKNTKMDIPILNMNKKKTLPNME